METPQEIQVWYILPAIRKHYAIYLKEAGLKQKEIASLLDITEAAVSQYLKNKRGNDVKFTEDILKEIKKSAQKVKEKKKDIRKETQNILNFVFKSPLMCGICHTHAGTPENCKICRGE